MFKQISSIHNSFVKELFQLKEKSRVRKKTERFLIEGKREIILAISGDYEVESLLFDNQIITYEEIEILVASQSTECIEVSSEVYQKLAYRSSTEGVIAVAKSKELSFDKIHFKSSSPLVLVAEAPEKPGNIGALLRTADAANIDAVIIANPKTDLYNPNIIRSSVGCVFTNQVATGTTTEIIKFLQSKNIQIYCAALLETSENYTKQNFKDPTALVVGTEATGLSDEWLHNSTKNIIIPMQGVIDSMNVSVSAGILIYEAKRQRDFK
jgi:TrmH family RNA methyltransferase